MIEKTSPKLGAQEEVGSDSVRMGERSRRGFTYLRGWYPPSGTTWVSANQPVDWSGNGSSNITNHCPFIEIAGVEWTMFDFQWKKLERLCSFAFLPRLGQC